MTSGCSVSLRTGYSSLSSCTVKWDLRVPSAALFYSSWHSDVRPRIVSELHSSQLEKLYRKMKAISYLVWQTLALQWVFATQGILTLRLELNQLQQGKSAEMNEIKGLQLLSWRLPSSEILKAQHQSHPSQTIATERPSVRKIYGSEPLAAITVWWSWSMAVNLSLTNSGNSCNIHLVFCRIV